MSDQTPLDDDDLGNDNDLKCDDYDQRAARRRAAYALEDAIAQHYADDLGIPLRAGTHDPWAGKRWAARIHGRPDPRPSEPIAAPPDPHAPVQLTLPGLPPRE